MNSQLAINYNAEKFDLDNMFKIHVDKKNNLVFNLNETMYLEIPNTKLKTFVPDHPLHWPTISYKIYGTTRLAWLLMKLNGVKAYNLFEKIPPTMPVYYIEDGDIMSVVGILTETNQGIIRK